MARSGRPSSRAWLAMSEYDIPGVSPNFWLMALAIVSSSSFFCCTYSLIVNMHLNSNPISTVSVGDKWKIWKSLSSQKWFLQLTMLWKNLYSFSNWQKCQTYSNTFDTYSNSNIQCNFITSWILLIQSQVVLQIWPNVNRRTVKYASVPCNMPNVPIFYWPLLHLQSSNTGRFLQHNKTTF